MKIKSSAKKDILFACWDTPVMHNDQLWLLLALHLDMGTHFFFQRNYKSKKELYELILPGRESYRITDEGLGIVRKYLRSEKQAKTKEMNRCSTFKIWNTPYAKDIFGSLPISKEELKAKEIFQYYIYTQNELIEFISLTAPEWKLHKNTKLEKLVTKYMKESL
jgi:hypothetical protein